MHQINHTDYEYDVDDYDNARYDYDNVMIVNDVAVMMLNRMIVVDVMMKMDIPTK